jgi:tetratricopeptide (TPR) repeat protein
MQRRFCGSDLRLSGMLLLVALAIPLSAQVRVWEGTLPLPTTVEGAPNPNPPFDVFATTKFNYPYTLRENLTGEEKEIAWRALFLENEYLKCSVLPDLGGHLYTCIDKISGQPMFYANPSIKKAQIGYRGAWAAFGIEFNFPVSHNWVSVSPVPFSTATHPDGSASIAVGNVDRPYGMQWTVELTLHPGCTLLEQRVTLYNRSDVRHRFYWWNNAGVRVWDDSRIFYPMRWTASHGFTEVNTWPVDSSGIDMSVIKNQVKGPVSLFVHGSREPFMGVYHPQTNTGVAHYADFAELPAKKIWSWGVDADGLDWRRALSDDKSAYVEVQAGLMRNQETYAFLEPLRRIHFTEYWMPVRGIGGITRANLTGVLNLERKNGKVAVAFHPNSAITGAQIRLLEGSHVLHDEHVNLSPGRTWSYDVADPAGKVAFVLTDTAGHVLMRHVEGEFDWSHESEIRTGPQERLTRADAIEAGTDQELNGKLLVAYDTYTSALARTSEIQALRVAAGRLAVTLLRDRDAVRWLAPAQARATSDPEIAYYLGLAYEHLGQTRAAREQFEAAHRMPEFRTVASVQLAEIAAREGDTARAIEYLRAASSDPRAADDLRMLEQPPESLQTSDAERILVAASDYMRLGLWRVALQVLSRDHAEVPQEQREPGVPAPKDHPLFAYYRAYCREKLTESAAADYATAAAMPVRYVFPNGAQTLAVLERAVETHPTDASVRYLLGNMRLQSGLVDDAVTEWRTAQRLNPAIPVLNASLGRTLLRLKHDPQGALESFRGGLSPDPLNPELYDGFATSAAILGRPAAERVAALERYPDLAHMPTALVYNLALSYAEAGMFDKARHLFENRFFPREEGGTNVRQVWIRVRALEAASKATHGQCGDALNILDHLGEPVAGLSFTNDGLGPFLEMPPNQRLFGSVEAACGRSDAAAKRFSAMERRGDLATLVFARASGSNNAEWKRRLQSAAERQNTGSSWQATVAGLAQVELGKPDKAAELLQAALLMPDRNLAHHIARVILAEIKR